MSAKKLSKNKINDKVEDIISDNTKLEKKKKSRMYYENNKAKLQMKWKERKHCELCNKIVCHAVMQKHICSKLCESRRETFKLMKKVEAEIHTKKDESVEDKIFNILATEQKRLLSEIKLIIKDENKINEIENFFKKYKRIIQLREEIEKIYWN